MITKIEPSTANNAISFYDVPNDLFPGIFQYLDLADCLTARQVCRLWEEMIAHRATIYSQYTQEWNGIAALSLLSPRFSAWEPMPRHWGLHNDKKMLAFSSICQDIIAFHPPFCRQSSKFFSFTAAIPFSDRNILLGQCGNTYFLTPQGKTRLLLDLQTDLQPLASHKLIVINTMDSTKNRKFSLLRDLPRTEDNLVDCQIEYCFPISEGNIVIITRNGDMTFWDLAPETPSCYQTLQIGSWGKVYQVESHLIFNDKIVNLSNLSLLKHGFEFENMNGKTFGSSLCTSSYALYESKIQFFAVNDNGLLEKKWDKDFCHPASLTPREDGITIALCPYIRDMNDKFIIATIWQSNEINLFVLDTEGEVVLSITQEIPGEPIDRGDQYAYPIFAHLSGNILIYKNPLKHTLYFWHIPTKTCIQEFEWTQSIYDVPLWTEAARIQDVHLFEGKLAILLSTGHTPLSNKPAQFRIIQFDPQYSAPSGLWGVCSRVCSAVKGAYYAFPGENPS